MGAAVQAYAAPDALAMCGKTCCCTDSGVSDIKLKRKSISKPPGMSLEEPLNAWEANNATSDVFAEVNEDDLPPPPELEFEGPSIFVPQPTGLLNTAQAHNEPFSASLPVSPAAASSVAFRNQAATSIGRHRLAAGRTDQIRSENDRTKNGSFASTEKENVLPNTQGKHDGEISPKDEMKDTKEPARGASEAAVGSGSLEAEWTAMESQLRRPSSMQDSVPSAPRPVEVPRSNSVAKSAQTAPTTRVPVSPRGKAGGKGRGGGRGAHASLASSTRRAQSQTRRDAAGQGLVIGFRVPDGSEQHIVFGSRRPPLGMEFDYASQTTGKVSTVVPGGHAEALGVGIDWEVASVNGVDVGGKDFAEVFELMRKNAVAS